MKKKRIELQKLEIESFHTNMRKSDNETIQGGLLSTLVCATAVSAWATTHVVDSLAFGDCPTQGNGLVCRTGRGLRDFFTRTVDGAADCPNINPTHEMSLTGGGEHCRQYSDTCPVSVGRLDCID